MTMLIEIESYLGDLLLSADCTRPRKLARRLRKAARVCGHDRDRFTAFLNLQYGWATQPYADDCRPAFLFDLDTGAFFRLTH
ncbi:MAG: hypothetical protein MJ192_08080 [Clostridia bacterium]|nr:hypothetical protein [Clostridia bacterium]